MPSVPALCLPTLLEQIVDPPVANNHQDTGNMVQLLSPHLNVELGIPVDLDADLTPGIDR